MAERAPQVEDRADAMIGRLALLWVKLALALAFLALTLAMLNQSPGSPEAIFLKTQDLWVLALMTVLFLAASRVRLPPFAAPAMLESRRAWIVAAAALSVLVVCRAGVGLVFEHFAMSLDEFMADFSAQIFSRGLLMAKVPQEWRGYTDALQPIFAMTSPGSEYWAGGYLPGNAYLRAAAGLVHLSDWLNPALAAVSIVALYGVARQLWPQNPRRALAAVALLGTSAQFLIMSMTAYAMAAHLALNLVWLWLFLRRRPASDAAALGLGFVGCGLHQLIFHPLFAAPFVLELWLARSWRRAIVFTLAYGAFGLFWISYTGLIFHWLGVTGAVGTAAAPAAGGTTGWLADHVAPLLAKANIANVALMAEMLIRFVTWQNLAVIPLAMVGGAAALKAKGPLRPLALGIVLTILIVGLLVPTQIHGWGYRYLHGFLGSACLLAVHGWTQVTRGLPTLEYRRAQTALALACLISALFLVPARAVQARQFSHPHAAAYASILAQPTDVVLVDSGIVGFDMGSMVRNDPFLSRRPKVMLLLMLDENRLTALCSRHSVSLWDARNPAARGVPTFDWPEGERRSAQLRAHLRAIGCVG